MHTQPRTVTHMSFLQPRTMWYSIYKQTTNSSIHVPEQTNIIPNIHLYKQTKHIPTFHVPDQSNTISHLHLRHFTHGMIITPERRRYLNVPANNVPANNADDNQMFQKLPIQNDFYYTGVHVSRVWLTNFQNHASSTPWCISSLSFLYILLPF